MPKLRKAITHLISFVSGRRRNAGAEYDRGYGDGYHKCTHQRGGLPEGFDYTKAPLGYDLGWFMGMSDRSIGDVMDSGKGI